MAKNYHCVRCNNTFASSQSLWNHKQRCDATEKAANAIFQKIGISSPTQPRAIAKVTEKATNSALQKIFGYKIDQRPDMGVKGSLAVQPIRDILNNVNRRVESRPTPSSNLVKKPKHEEPTKSTNQAAEYYLNHFSKSKLDQYFGIYKENGIYMMGSKEVVIDDSNNIRIDGADSFKGTKALWRLIMYKVPEDYGADDFESYTRLLEKTNAIDMPHKTGTSARPKNTLKWNFFKETGLVEEPEEETDEDNDEKPETGSGIQFLPSDINGLIQKLHLLLAESRAGNKSSTRDQIVAILDELLRRNYLTQEEYNGVCEQLLC